MDANKEEILCEWKAPEFRKNPKSADWFFGFGLIVIALLTWAIYTVNIMFVLVILLGAIALLSWTVRKPKPYVFQITRTGMYVGKNLVSFQDLESFWIFEFPDTNILSLKLKSRVSPGMHILVAPKDTPQVRNALSQFLVETEEQYSFADWLSDYLRF